MMESDYHRKTVNRAQMFDDATDIGNSNQY